MKRTMRFLSIALVVAMAVTGCHKQSPQPRNPENPNSGGNNGGNQGQETTLTLNQRSDWKVSYLGRDIYTADGSYDCVEMFQFTYTGTEYFIVRSITPADLRTVYAGKLEDFFQAEADILTANNPQFYEDTNNVFDASLHGKVAFNMLIHGQYTTYLIEIGKDGKLTGNYAATTHEVVEEEPDDAFISWIGKWHVSDDYVGYDIEVSSAEANHLYYIDGWETGPAVTEQMNQERDWLYARFRRDGHLYFYGQYLMSYYEESLGTDVDEMFVGTYLTSGSDANGEVDVEGADYNFDIAHTAVAEDGAITIEPESFTFDNGFQATYHSMRYSRYCYDEQNWAHYNVSGVPTLPLKMTLLTKASATDLAPVTRSATQATVHRYQPRRHVEKKVRSYKE